MPAPYRAERRNTARNALWVARMERALHEDKAGDPRPMWREIWLEKGGMPGTYRVHGGSRSKRYDTTGKR